MFNIKKNTKIFIACPAYFKTGGTELLHQLANELNKFTNVYIFYFDCKFNHPTNSSFLKYNVKFVKEISNKDNNINNILIVPEVNTDLLYKYNKMQRSIWWLSIDNFFVNHKASYYDDFRSKIMNYYRSLLNLKFEFGFNKNKYTHMAQSYYAVDYLKNKGIKEVIYLSDYINPIYLDEKDNQLLKEDIVLYNPKKGLKFTKKIIRICNENIKFVPLINLSNDEVSVLLKKSKVYIDFGEHPGKDRFPREAVASGCCIITGKKGAAKNSKDIPIPRQYKFADNEKNIPLIINKIGDCLMNYETNNKKFSEYRDMIKGEKEYFQRDVLEIFRLRNL